MEFFGKKKEKSNNKETQNIANANINKEEKELVNKKEKKEKDIKVSKGKEIGKFEILEFKKEFIDILLNYGIISDEELFSILERIENNKKTLSLTNFLYFIDEIDKERNTNIYQNIVKKIFNEKMGYEVILSNGNSISLNIKEAFNKNGLSPSFIEQLYKLGVIPIDINLGKKELTLLTTTLEIMPGFRKIIKELLGSSEIGNKTLSKVKMVITTPTYYDYYKNQLNVKNLTLEIN